MTKIRFFRCGESARRFGRTKTVRLLSPGSARLWMMKRIVAHEGA
jgi:hypothetical protein